MAFTFSELRTCIPSAGQAPAWDVFLEAFPPLQLAREVPQSPRYHGEGDVWTHTKMVVRSLLDHPEYAELPRDAQETVFLAALLHDVAKHRTTVIDPATGEIKHPWHSQKGAIDARALLWDLAMPFAQWEAVCRLIGVHQVPFWLFEHSRGMPPEFLLRKLSWQVSIPLLALLAEADIRGRICEDSQKVLDNIELFRELAKEDGCWSGPRAFADAHTRLSYFQGANVHPDYALHQPPGAKVTLMCGLPASGKDTWVSAHRKGLPVVSFDDARAELGLRHGKNEGLVAHHALDKARALLREQAPFVWCSTNLSQTMRTKSLGLLLAYNAEVEIVYLEASRAELLRRNTQRDSSLSNKTLLAMLSKWEVPLPTEAHSVQYNG